MPRLLVRALALVALLLLVLPEGSSVGGAAFGGPATARTGRIAAGPIARATPAPRAGSTSGTVGTVGAVAARAALSVRLRLKPATIVVGSRSRAVVRVRWHGHRVGGAVRVVVHRGHRTWTVRGRVRHGHASLWLPRLHHAGVYGVRAHVRGSAKVGSGRSARVLLTVRSSGGGPGATPPSGFPGPGTTGVPPGVALTAYTGPCTISTPGTVISRKRVTDCDALLIETSNVVIQDSSVQRVLLDQDVMNARGQSGWSFSITDSVVDGNTTDEPGVCCGNYKVTRTEMVGGHNGAQCENGADYCTVIDSWIHGQYEPAGGLRHLGGFLNDGGTPSTLIHNSITCDARAENAEGGCTGDVNLIPNFGPMAHVTVQNNYLGANPNSAFCTYGGSTPGDATYAAQANNIVYTGNVFGRSASISDPAPGQPSSTNQCAAYGPVVGFDVSAPGNTWAGNQYEDGTPIRCDASCD